MDLADFNRVLILAPHTDDGEFGCGGTISRLVKGKKNVVQLAFSSANQKKIEKEYQEASAMIGGITSELMEFTAREFCSDRQKILDAMIKVKTAHNPDVVFCPSTKDTHQDHRVVTNEAFRAFKQSTILGYELPWNCRSFRTDCFVQLWPADVDSKCKAIECYHSQADKFYARRHFIQSLATTRGIQVGVEYAEAFEVIRMVIK